VFAHEGEIGVTFPISVATRYVFVIMAY